MGRLLLKRRSSSTKGQLSHLKATQYAHVWQLLDGAKRQEVYCEKLRNVAICRMTIKYSFLPVFGSERHPEKSKPLLRFGLRVVLLKEIAAPRNKPLLRFGFGVALNFSKVFSVQSLCGFFTFSIRRLFRLPIAKLYTYIPIPHGCNQEHEEQRRKGAKVQSKTKDTKQKKGKTQPDKRKGKDVKEVRKPALKMKAPGGERKEPRRVTFAGTKVVNQGKPSAAKEKPKLDVRAIQETINKMADAAAARKKEAAATAKKDAKAEKIMALNAKVEKVLPKIKSPAGVTTPPCRVRSKSSPRPSPTENGTEKRKSSALETAAKKAQAVAELDAQEGMMTFLEDLKKELQVRGESVSDSVAAVLKSKVLDAKEAEGSDDDGSNADTEADDDEGAAEGGDEEGGEDASAEEEDAEDEEGASVAEEEEEDNGSGESEAEEEDEREGKCEEEEDDDEEEDGEGDGEEEEEDEAEEKAKGKQTELAKVVEATKE